MSLLVTGSVAIDDVTTPHGTRAGCLGGSAVYFCMAAGLFTPVRLVGAVGGDFGFDLREVFAGRDVDLAGLEKRPSSKTFRWTGSYAGTMETAHTDALELNVLAEEPPRVPAAFGDSGFVFLANTMPALQHRLLDQLDGPAFVAADSMNCWISGHRAGLEALLRRVHCFIVNADEARLLTGRDNLVAAARQIAAMGPAVVVIKKGGSGSLMCTASGGLFLLPAYPSAEVRDPTGAGDTFAGGFLGYLASGPAGGAFDFDSLKAAVAYGTVVASFTIEGFSLDALAPARRVDLDGRFEELRRLTHF
jgi:sugar/nucleoside kinase (ribokinase family)